VWWKPSTGEIVWSEENYRVMGYPVGITPTVELAMERCHPDDRARVGEALAAAIRDGTPAELEHRLQMPDGAVKHVRVVFQNVGAPDDPEYIGASADITEWKEAEERLRRSQAYLAEAQRLSSTGNFGWIPGEERPNWSDQTFRIFGLDPSVQVTRRAVLDRVHPDDQEVVRALVARAEAGRDVDEEFRLRMPGGAVKHVHVVARRVQGRDGGAEVVGAIQDVSRQRRSEEALGELRSELAHVSKVASIGALTASIAHEVNQPLTGVVTNAGTCLRMLAAEPADLEGARTTARRAIRDAERAADVIARVRSLLARRPPAAGPVDLNESAREVIALSRGELQRCGATARLELAEDLPPAAGDRVQLQQVIINLVRNALDAMAGVGDRPREVVVRTERHGDGEICLRVRDSGVGFEPRDAERLFDAFYSTKPDGMGIGLSVSRSIIASHRGRLWAEANDGPGATFAFAVPGMAAEKP
jgi:PAS domain S-box-containing protein